MNNVNNVPTVSVLMPVYNAERFLGKAVESVLAQTWTDFELIAVDDGSEDDSLSILKAYAENDDRIRVFSQPNQGTVAARNVTLKHARGEFLAMLDADDIAEPGRFVEQVKFLRENPDYVAVGSHVLLIDENDEALTIMKVLESHEAIENEYLRGGDWHIVNPAVMMRREAADKIGGYRDGYPKAEDVDFFMRLADHGKICNMPRVLTQYRQHFSSAGYDGEKTQHQSGFKAVNETRIKRGLPPISASEFFADIYAPPTPIGHNYRKWAWWALGYGNISTARKYAWKTCLHEPLVIESWRLLYCCLLNSKKRLKPQVGV